MKRIFILFIVLLMLSACANESGNKSAEVPQKAETYTEKKHIKAVWITYYELQSFTQGNDESGFINTVDKAFSVLANMGFNCVTVQVHPFADAFYCSKNFPVSKYCFSYQGADLIYDPLKIMCEIADKYNFRIEAWYNPYRVSFENNADDLCDSNKAKIWLSNKKTKSRVYVYKKGIYFNPANKAVNKLVVKGVKELVRNYDIDAIHFDDYFYPTTKKDIDKKEYKKYLSEGGKLSLEDFRRECVSNMVKDVYNAVKSVNNRVLFGISPSSDMNNNYEKLYADTKKWISVDGYVDYICPQIYFGFRNVYQPFMFTTKKWIGFSKRPLYVGLPLYKANRADNYAARNDKSIINEFVENDNIIQRQITYVSKLDEIQGVYIFSYSSLFDEKCSAEVNNMLEALKSY